MANKSHFNKGHISLNKMKKDGITHKAHMENIKPSKTHHALFTKDAVEFLKTLPDSSVQLVLVDPPYNIDLAHWDTFSNYLDWAKQWLDEIFRVLSDTGSCVIFGGFQYQDLKKGDLLEVLHYTRHNTKLRFVNLVIWYYKNGMSAHRFFANRHEEAIWLSKTKKYYFDLDSVRTPFDDATKALYLKDKRLNPESVEKGKNPTNVWEIGRLNGNSLERVGHPTQKPLEIIRRFVRGLAPAGSLVLDFFAGSGTTGRICIEEGRNSIMVDNDPQMFEYFKVHREKMSASGNLFVGEHDILINPDITEFLETVGKVEIVVEQEVEEEVEIEVAS